MAQGVVLSRRFARLAAAGGRRWAGLRGRGDCSRVPVLLGSVVCEPGFEKRAERREDGVGVMRNRWD